MANYANLKSTIDANVNTNGTEAITGAVLNSVLKQMVSTMGEAGYLYKGVATPATSPGTPDTNVWYLASAAGTYTNFGGKTVADGEVAILKYNGSWTKEVTGAATAAQVTQLGQEVNGLSEQVDFSTASYYVGNLTAQGTWQNTTTYAGKYSYYIIPLPANAKITVTANANANAFVLLLDRYSTPSNGDTQPVLASYSITAGTSQTFDAPTGAIYLYVRRRYYDTSIDYTPSASIAVAGIKERVETLESAIPSIETEITELDQEVNGFSLSFNGNNNTFAKNTNTGLYAVGGHTYRFIPTVRNWSHNNTTSTDVSGLSVGYLTGTTENVLYTLSTGTWQFKDYYDVTFPAAADNKQIFIGGRADSGTTVSFRMVDITELLAQKTRQFIPIASDNITVDNQTATLFLPINIKAGGKYVVHFKFPAQYVQLGGTYTTSSGIKITTTTGATDNVSAVVDTILQIFYRSGVQQEDFLEFTATADAAFVAFYSHLYGMSANCLVEAGIYPETLSIDNPGVVNLYSGETIRIYGRKHSCKEITETVRGIKLYNGKSSQGLAIYGKYAFITYDTGYIQVLDLDSRAIVGAYSMPEGVQGANNHAGMANFGYIFYDQSDPFPLLYVSSYLENKCYVLRVTLDSCSLIQTITMTDAYHFLPDNDGKLVVHLAGDVYCIFNVPEITDSEVTLSSASAQKSFTFATTGMLYAGAICQDDIMYVLAYYNSSSVPAGVTGQYDRLMAYNYNTESVVSEIVFQSQAIRNVEFEGLAIADDGVFVISFIADQLAKIIVKQ